MGNCFGSPATLPPDPIPQLQPDCPRPAETAQGSNEEHAHATVQGDRVTMTSSTSSSRPRAPKPSRALSQGWESSQPHHDGTDYLPSFGDVLASHDPRRQETFPQKKRLPPSGRMNRMNSENLLGNNGRASQFGSSLTAGPGQIPVEIQESRPRFPSTLKSLLPNEFRFRILVVGKRDSGKSSLIETIFKVDMSRAPTNVSGITVEFRPRDNRHLIVHECSASEPGELQAIRDFITLRNHKSSQPPERLHAIWICIPMSDVVSNQFNEGLELLLGTGVPIVVVFTMFDQIVPNVPSHGNEYEKACATAYMTWEGHCRSLFGNVRAEIVSTRPRFRDLVVKLVATTDEVIISHSRNFSASSEAQRTQPRMSLVPLAWSVSQRASRDINILTAIERSWAKQLFADIEYWRGLWSGDDFRGQILANCIEVIHADIVGVWNLPNKDSHLSSKAFRGEISYLVQDLSGALTSTTSRSKPNGTSVTGAAWLTYHHENSKEKICLVVGYIVDLILILCSVFKSPSDVSPGEVQSVINNFASSSRKTNIHNDISNFIRIVPQLQYHDNDVVMAKITDLISGNCDLPRGNAHV